MKSNKLPVAQIVQTLQHPTVKDIIYMIHKVAPDHPEFERVALTYLKHGLITEFPDAFYYFEENGDWYTDKEECASDAKTCMDSLFKSPEEQQYYTEHRVFNCCTAP